MQLCSHTVIIIGYSFFPRNSKLTRIFALPEEVKVVVSPVKLLSSYLSLEEKKVFRSNLVSPWDFRLIVYSFSLAHMMMMITKLLVCVYIQNCLTETLTIRQKRYTQNLLSKLSQLALRDHLLDR